jgi:hypothetical protein
MGKGMRESRKQWTQNSYGRLENAEGFIMGRPILVKMWVDGGGCVGGDDL